MKMKKNKKFVKISGKVQSPDFSRIFNKELDDNEKQNRVVSKNFSMSTDERLNQPIIAVYGGGTTAIRRYWSLKLKLKSKLKDEWELENWINKKLYEGANIGERDILTKDVEKVLSEDIIQFYEEKLKEKKIQKNEIESVKNYIKDLKEILEGYNEENI